jgi:hypothetical protein
MEGVQVPGGQALLIKSEKGKRKREKWKKLR